MSTGLRHIKRRNSAGTAAAGTGHGAAEIFLYLTADCVRVCSGIILKRMGKNHRRYMRSIRIRAVILMSTATGVISFG